MTEEKKQSKKAKQPAETVQTDEQHNAPRKNSETYKDNVKHDTQQKDEQPPKETDEYQPSAEEQKQEQPAEQQKPEPLKETSQPPKQKETAPTQEEPTKSDTELNTETSKQKTSEPKETKAEPAPQEKQQTATTEEKASKEEKSPEKEKQAKPQQKTEKQEKPPKGKDEDFRYIVRIADTDIDGDKQLIFGLSQIKGIGRHLAYLVVKKTKIKATTKMGDLTDKQIDIINDVLSNITSLAPSWMLNHRKDMDTGEDIHLISAQVSLRLRDDVNMLKMIRSYRGIRHELNLPVRGQRTRGNNRRGLALGVSRKRV